MKTQPVKGFSKLSKEAKIEWLIQNFTNHPDETMQMLTGYWHGQPEVQKLHDEFIENTISNIKYIKFNFNNKFSNQKYF
jgi:hydroxymethylglutaryl-CoA reductase